jgi:hypothetical protein
MHLPSPPAVLPLTREQVLHIVGEVDDLVISEILGTGATEGELREAVDEAEAELVEGLPTPPASSPRVALLRALLSDVKAAILEPDDRD